MKYRKATIEDVSILTDLRIEFLIEANGQQLENENELKKKIASHFHSHLPTEKFVAWVCITNNNTVIGTSGISFYEVPPSYSNPSGRIGHISNMYTKKPYRREGIASSLFQKMLEEGLKKNVSKFLLNTTRDGKSLYEKFGFVLNGDEMHLIVK
jgi:GNAT superfamily N-acetyltransferase